MKEQIALRYHERVGHFARDFTVGNAHSRYLFKRDGFSWVFLGETTQYSRSFSGNPPRVSHQAAKVPAVEMRVFVGHYIGEAGALGGLRPMLEAVVKGLQNVFRKLWWMRISRFDSAPLRVGEIVIADSFSKS
jgi:hypothetical protein